MNTELTDLAAHVAEGLRLLTKSNSPKMYGHPTLRQYNDVVIDVLADEIAEIILMASNTTKRECKCGNYTYTTSNPNGSVVASRRSDTGEVVPLRFYTEYGVNSTSLYFCTACSA